MEQAVYGAASTFKEQICLTYQIENVSDYLDRGTSYAGEDRRLADHDDLILSAVRPILREWGY